MPEAQTGFSDLNSLGRVMGELLEKGIHFECNPKTTPPTLTIKGDLKTDITGRGFDLTIENGDLEANIDIDGELRLHSSAAKRAKGTIRMQGHSIKAVAMHFSYDEGFPTNFWVEGSGSIEIQEEISDYSGSPCPNLKGTGAGLKIDCQYFNAEYMIGSFDITADYINAYNYKNQQGDARLSITAKSFYIENNNGSILPADTTIAVELLESNVTVKPGARIFVLSESEEPSVADCIITVLPDINRRTTASTYLFGRKISHDDDSHQVTGVECFSTWNSVCSYLTPGESIEEGYRFWDLTDEQMREMEEEAEIEDESLPDDWRSDHGIMALSSGMFEFVRDSYEKLKNNLGRGTFERYTDLSGAVNRRVTEENGVSVTQQKRSSRPLT